MDIPHRGGVVCHAGMDSGHLHINGCAEFEQEDALQVLFFHGMRRMYLHAFWNNPWRLHNHGVEQGRGESGF